MTKKICCQCCVLGTLIIVFKASVPQPNECIIKSNKNVKEEKKIIIVMWVTWTVRREMFFFSFSSFATSFSLLHSSNRLEFSFFFFLYFLLTLLRCCLQLWLHNSIQTHRNDDSCHPVQMMILCLLLPNETMFRALRSGSVCAGLMGRKKK